MEGHVCHTMSCTKKEGRITSSQHTSSQQLTYRFIWDLLEALL